MEADPDLIKADVAPLLKHITPSIIEDVLNELQDVGLVIIYSASGKNYLQLQQFEKNQRNLRKDREAPSEIPKPDKFSIVRINSGLTPDELRTDSGIREEKRSEVKRSEVNARESDEPDRAVDNSKPALSEIEPEKQKKPDALMIELREVTEEIGTLMPEPFKQRQMMTFVEANIRNGNHSAILDCLKSMLKQLRQGEVIDKPRAYLEAAMRIEDGKHNAKEYAADARKRDGPMTKQGLTALGRVLAGINA